RLTFLVEASSQLAMSLDYQTTLNRIARLAVPEFADLCRVDILESGGRVSRVAIAGYDEAIEEQARALDRRYPFDPEAPYGVARVLKPGQTEWHSEIHDDRLARIARDRAHLETLRRAGLTSIMYVPLPARGQTIGVMSFMTLRSGRRYDREDVVFAEELARRA